MRAANFRYEVLADGQHPVLRIAGTGVAGEPIIRDYGLGEGEQHNYLDLYESVARDFGTRMPRNRSQAARVVFEAPYQPILTENVSPDILYGYGDPAVLRADDHYYLFVTSNDAPNAFPILRSSDLKTWERAGFVFPEGSTPEWAAAGPHQSDYWAPEVQRIGDRYVLCFAARGRDGALSIGLATAPAPDGPYAPLERPLIEGGVIDAHIFLDGETPLLFWKEDSNDLWPGLLAELLRQRGDLASQLFSSEPDVLTASLTQVLWPWIGSLDPMERFFALQPLIEAVTENFSAVRAGLAALGGERERAVLDAMRTPIFAQRLSADGLDLVGERHVVMVNDLEWEGHLIEGPWVTRQQDLYYLFYAGNDFSTAEYGIGVAMAGNIFGPYRKMEQPLLRSTKEWAGPGHPSMALAQDGSPRLFFHAFQPGHAGYKEFRALLSVGLEFGPEGVAIRP